VRRVVGAVDDGRAEAPREAPRALVGVWEPERAPREDGGARGGERVGRGREPRRPLGVRVEGRVRRRERARRVRELAVGVGVRRIREFLGEEAVPSPEVRF